MVDMNTRLRRMGNSLGIIVPSEIVNQKGLKEGAEVVVSIQNRNRTTIGDMLEEARRRKLRFKRTTQEILDELDKELD